MTKFGEGWGQAQVHGTGVRSLFVDPYSFVMAVSRGSADRPARNSSGMMTRALRPTGKAARPTTGAPEFLGGRSALPRDAAMTNFLCDKTMTKFGEGNWGQAKVQ